MKYEVVLWDFDGTLVDTSEGIFQSLRKAFSRMGMPDPGEQVLSQFIGPPLLYSLRTLLGMPEEQAAQAVNFFREDYYASGIYRSEVYNGLENLIIRLRENRVRVGVATLKPEKMANLLLRRFQLDSFFDVCSGVASDSLNSATKSQIIDEALARLGYQDRSKVVMIGDTVYDARGARESGIDFIAAAYGFGLREKEQCGENCVCIAENAADIDQFLFGGCL